MVLPLSTHHAGTISWSCLRTAWMLGSHCWGDDQAHAPSGCGQPAYFSRIVGGQSAADGSWPWQVSILKNSEHHCGGSLIDKQWVLSAAHCFYSDTTISQYKVILGAYQLSNPSSHAFTSSVKQIIIHPDSNGEATSGNDIALLKLTFPVHFTNYIMPICLPNSSVQFFTNVDCWITGWGDTQPDVPLKPPQTLQEVRVPLLNQSSCNELYNAISLLDKDPIKPDMLCAGFPEGGKDACQRDSGGPLVCKCNEHWILAGAVSWGIGCALPNLPGVYISVPYYANWIHEEIPEMNFSLCQNGGNGSRPDSGSDSSDNTVKKNILRPCLYLPSGTLSLVKESAC
uniref:Peptidase S1 domain-containing protein n=1 Tax=Salvator merianae TaxID=96440 RepID=A0A8D0B5R9_SALMN